MAAVTIRRTGLLLALTATLLAVALVLIGRAGADDGDPLPAPTGLQVTAERGSLDVSLDWDDVSGAAHYWVRWRVSGPDNKLNDGVQVRSSDAVITVTRYGEWVARVQACDDAGCGAPLAKKFRVRRPRAVPDITPLPTSTPTPLPTATPTPEPTATSTPLPTSSPTPEPTATSMPLPTATSIPEPTSTPTVEPAATATPEPSVPIPDEPAGLSVSATPGSLEVSVDWDDVSGASYYWVRWRESGSGNELNEGVVVLPSEAVIAVSDYGEWVIRAQACTDSGCGAPASSKFIVVLEPTATPTPEPLGEPQNLEVIAEPGSKALLASWDAVEGATSYELRWRKNGREFETADAATVSGAIQYITVSDYGRWEVRVQGCNDSGCGSEAAATVEAVGAASMSLERAVDDEGNIRSRTLSANWDPVEGAASYTLRWQRLSDNSQANTQTQAQSASNARQSHSASVVSGKSADTRTTNQLTFSAEETGSDFTVPDDGAYRAEFRALNDGGELIALAHGHVNQAPGQPDTTAPRLEWGEIDGNRVRLYFSEPLNEDVMVGYFNTIMQRGNCWCYSSGTGIKPIEISGNVVVVNLGRPTIEGLRASISYIATPGDRTGLRDIAGNPVRIPYHLYQGQWQTRRINLYNITGRPKIVPLTPGGAVFDPSGVAISSDAGDDRFYTAGDTIAVKLTFSESVNVTGTPRLKIDLDPAAGAGEKWADYSAGSGTRMLEFAYTVASADISADGVAVLENTLELNGGTIRAAWARGVEEARLGHPGLEHNSRHRVLTPDSANPALQSASVTGTALTLTFSETLGAAASLANDAFTVKKTPQGGSEQNVSLSGSPAISGSTVILTLESATLDTDTGVNVSYAKPTTGTNNKLVDAGGAEAADFTDEPVKNTLDTTKPELLRGEIDGDVVTLYFSEHMDKETGGKGDYYRITLKWSEFIGSAPQPGRCRGISTDTSSFTAVTARPREVLVSGSTVTVVGLTEDARFRAGVGQNSNAAYYYADVTTPADQRLRDISGNHVSTTYDFFNRREERYRYTKPMDLPSVTKSPHPRSAGVNGNRLTLTFSAPMDGESKPAASAFTVKVNGSAVSLASANPVGISDDTVTLRLAAAVTASDTVTVSYAKPDSSPLRNIVCEYAPSFTDQPVTNSTP